MRTYALIAVSLLATPPQLSYGWEKENSILSLVRHPVMMPPGTPQPSAKTVCTVQNEATVGDLWSTEAGHFDYENWNFLVPDAGYYRVILSHNGKTVLLSSAHPVFEEDSKLVAKSTGISALENQTREDAERTDDAGFIRKKKAFDRLMQACMGEGGK
jgi:hypothetical protein